MAVWSWLRAAVVCAFGYSVGALAPASAAQLLLTSDDYLEIRFVITQTPTPPDDVMMLSLFHSATVLAPFTTTTATLFNGVTPLGVHTSALSGGLYRNVWTSPASLFTYNTPTDVDMSAINDGSIDGIIRLTIDSGALLFDPFFTYLTLGRAISAATILTEGGDHLSILSVEVVAPVMADEPSASAIVAVSAILLARRRARSRGTR